MKTQTLGQLNLVLRRAQGGVIKLAQAFAWDEDAHYSIDGAISDGEEYAHPDDAVIQFFLDSLPSTSSIYIGFRQVDADNYWAVEISSDGSAALQEYVSGSPTDRDTAAAGTLSGGEAIAIVCVGDSKDVYADGVNILSYMTIFMLLGDTVARPIASAWDTFTYWMRKIFFKPEFV